jgi:putative sigma-54 modulation protein
MNLNLTCRQFDITPSIREYVESKVAAVTADKMLKISSISVVMEREKEHFHVNIVLNCKYHVFEAAVGDFDLYKAFDASLDKIDVQLTKLKEKIRDHHAEPMREAEAELDGQATDNVE